MENNQKIALITGVAGQDGSYLAEYLLDLGYQKVVGLYKRSSQGPQFLDLIEKHPRAHEAFEAVEGDITESYFMDRLFAKYGFTEVYNLAAQSHVGTSFEVPLDTNEIDFTAVLEMLELIRTRYPNIRFYQASTSEMFGGVPGTEPQSEATPFHPQSPYAVSKLAAHHMVRLYRESYGLYVCSGILFNHESPRRGVNFLPRKVSLGLSRIKLGLQDRIELGNLAARRDWGDAREYVKMMQLMLSQEPGRADDYVIGTGQTYTIKQCVEVVAKALDMTIRWEGEGVGERGIWVEQERPIIFVNPVFYRPAEVHLLLSDPSKAAAKLGWRTQVSFEQLMSDMALSDLEEQMKGNFTAN